ncbi:hypothetical protein N7495_004411 [Penicillium taxi]|uniref:uncharacterized protein n=1 Tax=Penicillium taxi TaxID=168475 RepID=UPI00254565D5|nr:uncharacterized protein N7495_004411 [Penicillium taxi]KAJ5899667.1 hypothetical protein N7495_004411 [Penicillium taxi]
MPKKHRNPFLTRPSGSAHHSLTSNHGESSYTSETRSVNDLITHLRRTQITSSPEHQNSHSSSFNATRSLPPALRNVLELPETLPPRPRDARRTQIGGRPRRPPPGPPPPDSWGVRASENVLTQPELEEGKVIYRLDRLPGCAFPGEQSILHQILKSMSKNWAFHLEYDGNFLSQIPVHIKVLLLSYIAAYGIEQNLKDRMVGLKPLFLSEAEMNAMNAEDEDEVDEPDEAAVKSFKKNKPDDSIMRLDLGHAIGYWISIKQLTNELLISNKTENLEDEPPSSWDESLYEERIPKSIRPRLRFKNIRYLSLAHPNSLNANWKSLLHIMPHLSTITHLSLAWWPTPNRHGSTRKPQTENEWAEAASTLRLLSRVTYCLKWLDLEGCSSWFSALTWSGSGSNGASYPRGSCGPEWNGSWRDIDTINLSPGWEPWSFTDIMSGTDGDILTRNPSTLSRALDRAGLKDDDDRQRAEMEIASLREVHNRAESVAREINQIRKEDKGKWMRLVLN